MHLYPYIEQQAHFNFPITPFCSGLLTTLASPQPHNGACKAAVFPALGQTSIKYDDGEKEQSEQDERFLEQWRVVRDIF